ncbi:MAG TPA: GGDEF domain-containing protein [Vicinamibacterales bacterium]|jgi:diguanylate cyclase (GGDEF)-like protein|nr:GGDEF domain-containing protein [Vicinamibacterales bacterium]
MDDGLLTAVERYKRTGDHASLLLIDIDRFKALNDASGHGEGDRVLQRTAALIGQRLRRIDALFRLGGDEFVVLLSGAWLSDARAVAEQRRPPSFRNSPAIPDDGGRSRRFPRQFRAATAGHA